MVIEYNGYKAEVGFKDRPLIDVEFGRIGRVYLLSDILHCKSVEDLFYERDIILLQNIYIQYFKNKINKLQGGGIE
jgi:hypothetical protein